MPMMYCPHCETNVLTAREDIDICLVVILALFTAGIGLIFYLVYYFSEDENRCVHCNSRCLPQKTGQVVSLTTPVVNPYLHNHENQQVQIIQTNINENTSAKYCSNCGSKLERQNISFCPYCGTNIV